MHTDCKGLRPEPGGRCFKRVYTRCKNLLNAKSIEKKIVKLREGVRDAKSDFTVCKKNRCAVSQNYNYLLQMMTVLDLKINSDAAQLHGGIKTRVEVAERDSGEARKIFGVDQMSNEERKVELRKATLVCFPDALREA